MYTEKKNIMLLAAYLPLYLEGLWIANYVFPQITDNTICDIATFKKG